MFEVTSSMIALSGRICQVPPRPLGSRNLGTLLRDPWLELNARLNATVAERGFADVRPALSVVFQHLRDEGSRITEIAERAQLTKQTVVYLVNELEALGYVERAPDPQDGRAKIVVATQRGRAAVVEARRVAGEFQREMAELLGAERMAELRALLEELHDALWPETAA
jgi:DNA-binding MarR family transcriptional regulator